MGGGHDLNIFLAWVFQYQVQYSRWYLMGWCLWSHPPPAPDFQEQLTIWVSQDWQVVTLAIFIENTTNICLQRRDPLQLPAQIFIMHGRVPSLQVLHFPNGRRIKIQLRKSFFFIIRLHWTMIIPYPSVLILWDEHGNCRNQIHPMFWRSWEVSALPASMDVGKSCLIFVLVSVVSDNCITQACTEYCFLFLLPPLPDSLILFITILFIFTFIENFG